MSTVAPLTICHFDAERKFSGGEVQVFLLMHGLRARGHRSILVAPRDSLAIQRARHEGFEVRECEMASSLDVFSLIRAGALLRELRPDLVHLHTARAAWLGGLAAARLRLPAIVTRRMDRVVRPGWRTRLVYQRLTLRTAAISASVAQALRDGGVPSDRIVVIRSSIDPSTCRALRSRAQVRRDLGVKETDAVVLSLGALVERKGLDSLLRALALLASRGQKPYMWIAGDGEQRARLEALARELALERVRFLGRRSDAADLLGAADVFAMPSRREGLGVAALEALGAGCAVVATQVGGLAEVVETEISGLLVPVRDDAALADALDRLLRDAGLRSRLATAGRARIGELYHVDTMVASYEALYRSVLARDPAAERGVR